MDSPGKRSSQSYSVNRQQARDKTMAIPNGTTDVLRVLHATLSYADRSAIKKMAQSGAVPSLKIAEHRSTENCSFFVQPRTTVEKRPGAESHTSVAEMNVSSAFGASYFVMLIDRAPRHVSTCIVETKGDASRFLKRYLRWGRHPCDCQVKKIVFDGGKEYSKRIIDLESAEFEVLSTAVSTLRENGHFKRVLARTRSRSGKC